MLFHTAFILVENSKVGVFAEGCKQSGNYVIITSSNKI